jgi:hypothetical protein
VPAAPAAGPAAMPALPLSACASRAGCAAAGHDSACAPRHASSAINQGRESEDEPEYTSVGGAADAADELALLPSEAGARRASGGDLQDELAAVPMGAENEEQGGTGDELSQGAGAAGAAGGEKEEEVKRPRRPKGVGAKKRRDKRRRDEGISAAQPARSLVVPAPRLVPPPRPPPGPPPPWSVPVPSMMRPPQGRSRHLVWINLAAASRPPPRAAQRLRAAQHPIARAQQRAGNAVAAAARATAGAQVVAQHAAEVAAIATRLVAERCAPAVLLAPPVPPAPPAPPAPPLPPSRCSASLVFQGTLPEPVHGCMSWREGEHSQTISAIFEQFYAFLCIPDETFDGVPIYVLQHDIYDDSSGASEVVLYRMPSRENAPGSVWAIRCGDALLAYGIDERDVRDGPGSEAVHGGPSWCIGNLYEPKESDVRASNMRLIDTFPTQRATRAAMGIELAPVAFRP